MGLFSRRRASGGKSSGKGTRAQEREEAGAVRQYLDEFVRTRVGVEAFLEPPTTVTPPTVLLIATTGEWTRRRVPDHAAARDWAGRLNVPVYDVQLVGYPQRMRDWNEKVKREGRQAPPTG
ncbi:oxidoreductase [Spongisporangium articulatum]|uniref:Oxidoreductase n=1 Tax=Spongisporangium articulatum TaxID=3362603 RepID=A0ABW8AT14_9ACTN